MKFVMFFVLLFVSVVSFADTPVTTAPGGPVSWVFAHSGALSAFGVAIFDLLFALNPDAKAADGILHAVYLFFKKLSQPTPPQA